MWFPKYGIRERATQTKPAGSRRVGQAPPSPARSDSNHAKKRPAHVATPTSRATSLQPEPARTQPPEVDRQNRRDRPVRAPSSTTARLSRRTPRIPPCQIRGNRRADAQKPCSPRTRAGVSKVRAAMPSVSMTEGKRASEVQTAMPRSANSVECRQCPTHDAPKSIGRATRRAQPIPRLRPQIRARLRPKCPLFHQFDPRFSHTMTVSSINQPRFSNREPLLPIFRAVHDRHCLKFNHSLRDSSAELANARWPPLRSADLARFSQTLSCKSLMDSPPHPRHEIASCRRVLAPALLSLESRRNEACLRQALGREHGFTSKQSGATPNGDGRPDVKSRRLTARGRAGSLARPPRSSYLITLVAT